MESNLAGYKQEFIEFIVQSEVLTFGDFTTKSGRKTPYFINTGNFKTGAQMVKLGFFYAKALVANFSLSCFNVLYGAAYKGIPLVTATAMQLSEVWKIDCGICFNRKEAKDHGEGGMLIGHKPVEGDRIILIDDVITAGTSTRESMRLLSTEAPEAQVVGGMISVDRMEKGKDDNRSAIQEVMLEFALNFFAIVTIDEIVAYLHNREIDGKIVLDDRILDKIQEYRSSYGI